jgi:hypothetical protein
MALHKKRAFPGKRIVIGSNAMPALRKAGPSEIPLRQSESTQIRHIAFVKQSLFSRSDYREQEKHQYDPVYDDFSR